MDESIESVSKLFDAVVKFVVAYDFQVIGALAVLPRAPSAFAAAPT